SVWLVTKEEKRGTEEGTWRGAVDERTGTLWLGRNEHLEKNPPPAGEYWKNVPVTRALLRQVFSDLSFSQAWLLAGYGSVLARKKLSWNAGEFAKWEQERKETLAELAADLDPETAIHAFAEMMKDPGDVKYDAADFAELFGQVARRDEDKMLSVLERTLQEPAGMDRDEIALALGEAGLEEWLKLADETAAEDPPENYEDDMDVPLICADCFAGKPACFDAVGKKIPPGNRRLERYHALLRKLYAA
ncbi:MAG TPA: hypothetical protein VFU15_14625, partial [Bacteroidia bacterium]|nr:hypothetical protein [Bacteroidia bacterium]